MSTYVILSKVSSEALTEPKQFKGLAADVSRRIKEECPDVKWKDSYVTLGRFDVVDIVESDDLHQVEKAVMIIRAYGHTRTETMVATPWRSFIEKL